MACFMSVNQERRRVADQREIYGWKVDGDVRWNSFCLHILALGNAKN